MKIAPPNSVVLLLTCPVGDPGTLTSRLTFVKSLPATSPEYRVAVLVPALETQNGPVAPYETPHGFWSKGSVIRAMPSMFETRFVTWKESACEVRGANANKARPNKTAKRA